MLGLVNLKKEKWKITAIMDYHGLERAHGIDITLLLALFMLTIALAAQDLTDLGLPLQEQLREEPQVPNGQG